MRRPVTLFSRATAAFLVGVVLFLVVSALFSFGERVETKRQDVKVVMHGGGEIWGWDREGKYRSYTGSNSLEALLQCADAGQTTVELDFSLTAEGELVCIHHWDETYIAEAGTGVMMRDAFSRSKIYGQFTPLTLSDVLAFMREREDMVLVTDFKDDFVQSLALLATAGEDLQNRIVVQIYRPTQYDLAAKAGFTHIAYTLYALSWEEKTDTAAHYCFAKDRALAWIAFDEELLSLEGFVEAMQQTGVPLYVHTVNDEDTYKSCLELGIDGIYTDRLRRRVEKD